MLNVNIDGKEIKGYAGQTILELARENGIEIPTLCHDERLKTYGACGLCVVEIEGNNRLSRACATEISPGMVVITDSERVLASRKMTLELLLSDHSGDCRPPCVKACPAHTDCQGYVGLIANGEYQEALKLIKEQLPLPASIGLVCPHPCEEACRRQLVEEPISIAALKTFVAEQDIYNADAFVPEKKAPSGKRVAIIGGGPAGLTAAHFLAIEGHEVFIYEAMPQAGGMLRYGIPQYRLPKEILDQEIRLIEALGVKIICNIRINQDISFDYIRQNYDAVFIGIGAWKYTRIGCPGEDVAGVIGGIDFLREAALNGSVQIGDRVAVIGGGNTAMDAARTAVRLGAQDVMVLYRRTREEMPAEDIEIEEAEEEGVEFKFLLAPEEIIAEAGRATAIRCQKMRLGEADSSGRRKPVPIEGAQELIPVDTIIAAIGQQVDASDLPGLQMNKWKCIDTDASSLQTNFAGVFAGGDAVTGPGIAIGAIAQGKKAALAMIAYLNGVAQDAVDSFTVERSLTAEDFTEVARVERVKPIHRDPTERRQDFMEIAGRMTPEQARQEANRCLECGCQDYFECKLIKYASEYKVDPRQLQGDKHTILTFDEHPYIERDAAKCILCGLCVRICDEMMGVGALGLVHRGFDTLVKPEFGKALQDSACISCGQCVSVCPTGALIESNAHLKNVPLQLAENSSHCSFCGLGCGQIISSRGDSVFKIVPDQGEALCSKGRFGFAASNVERLSKPLLREAGELKESSWEQALTYIAKKSLAVKAKSAAGSMAVFAAPSLTLEEAQLAASWKDLLATDKLASFSPDCGRGLNKVLGANQASNNLAEMAGTNLILMLGSFNENQVLPARIRNAVGQGAELLVISPEATLVDDIAKQRVCTVNNTAFIKEILAAVLAQGLINERFVKERAEGYAELSAALKTITPGEDAQQIAAAYAGAKKAMILVDGYTVSAAAVELMADLVVLTGKVGSARNGIIVINPGVNTNGIWQAGFQHDGTCLIQEIVDGDIKAAYILGEDPVGAGLIDELSLSKLDFLMVASPFLTDTAAQADVVLPLSAMLESSGSYITADGTIINLQAVKKAPAGKNNMEIWSDLSSVLNPLGTKTTGNPNLVGSKAYRYAQGFATTNGKAQLAIGKDEPIFVPVKITDPILIKFKG